ncbi:MAG: GTPase [bacterium]
MSRLSSARPKIADYPFTTLEPNLGIVKVSENASFVMADIPGLIEGAHNGKGLGHDFLKHIQRTRILLFLIDISSRNIYRDFEILLKEISCFNKDMLRKPIIIALNKIDIVQNKRILVSKFTNHPPVLKISAVTGKGIPCLLSKLSKYVFR